MTASYTARKCPNCFSYLPDEWAWRSKTADADDDVTVQTPTTDEEYTALLAEHDEVCPLCHYELLPYWRWSTVVCIAMAGARYTGKTVYIAVLMKALERLGDRFGQVVAPADASTRTRYRTEYEQPLYEHQGLAKSTPSSSTHEQRPLIFSLGRWNEATTYLVIRDVAGEDLENPDAAAPGSLDFFSRADAVFFLFDPLPAMSVASNSRSVPNGTSRPATEISPVVPSPAAYQRRS